MLNPAPKMRALYNRDKVLLRNSRKGNRRAMIRRRIRNRRRIELELLMDMLLKHRMIAGDDLSYYLCIFKVFFGKWADWPIATMKSIQHKANCHISSKVGRNCYDSSRPSKCGADQPSQSKFGNHSFQPTVHRSSVTMASTVSSDILSTLPNLDEASKVEISKVITEETRKAELQASTHPPNGPSNFSHSTTTHCANPEG